MSRPQFQLPTPPDPLQQREQVLSLSNLERQRKLQGQQQQMQQGQIDEAAMERAKKRAADKFLADDPDLKDPMTVQRIIVLDPPRGEQLFKALKARTDAGASERKAALDELTLTSKLFEGPRKSKNKPVAYDQTLRRLKALGYDTSQYPQQYSPEADPMIEDMASFYQMSPDALDAKIKEVQLANETDKGADANKPKPVRDYINDQGQHVEVLQGRDGKLTEQVLGKVGPTPTNPRQQVPGVDIPLPADVVQQRKDIAAAGKTPTEPTDLQSAVSVTRSGLKYVDFSQFTGKERNALVAAANKAGIPAVSKETGDLLSEIDNARENLDYMNQTIGPKLAKDAAGRPLVSLTNTIEKLAQTDPDLAAVGTYRSAAIQAMRAVAGAKGLRINRAEIEQAQENDIPKMTDTLPVAQQKLKNMMKFLDNAEKAHVVKDRSAAKSTTPDKPPAFTLPNGSTVHLQADGTYK